MNFRPFCQSYLYCTYRARSSLLRFSTHQPRPKYLVCLRHVHQTDGISVDKKKRQEIIVEDGAISPHPFYKRRDCCVETRVPTSDAPIYLCCQDKKKKNTHTANQYIVFLVPYTNKRSEATMNSEQFLLSRLSIVHNAARTWQ